MYRRYEDPFAIGLMLDEAKSDLEEAKASGDEERIISESERVADLEERLNFAWQDDEYDSEW